VLKERQMLGVARVGEHDAPGKGPRY
jgi:hypothetical protein